MSRLIGLLTAALILGTSAQAIAEDGVTDTEVRIGHSAPYSGPVSAYGITGRAFTAYFDKVNKDGGIAGRKIVILSRDDAYSPPKAVEVTRQLVEKEHVLAMVAVIGAANNMAIRSYLNDRKIPQLFAATGASEVAGDPEKFPYTTGWVPSYKAEGAIIARHILKTIKNPKVAVLYQNDDLGKDYLKGLKTAFGDKVNDIVISEKSYETSAPTVNSEVISLKGSGANVFVNFATPKFAALAIRKIGELQWKPTQYVNVTSISVGAVLKPAGLANAQGLISFQFAKDPSDPRWANDEGFLAWSAFMDKYLPGASKSDVMAVLGYSHAESLKAVLEMAGRDLNRTTLLNAATHIKNVQLSMLLPGIKLNTTPADRFPISCLQMATFKDESWVTGGDLVCEH